MLANGVDFQARLIVWIFAMRILMILTSLFSYWLNGKISEARYGKEKIFDFEKPLTSLIWADVADVDCGNVRHFVCYAFQHQPRFVVAAVADYQLRHAGSGADS